MAERVARRRAWDAGGSDGVLDRAPPRAIQKLAGHRELGMTQRYMHLSPAALDSAIRLLDQPAVLQSFGDLLGTGRVSEGKING
jgi:hypothetical protein